MQIFDLLLNQPLGFLFRTLYDFFSSYGLTIILFTVITRVILAPLSIKQQKSMVKTAAIQPKMKEIEKKYKTDKQKQSEELMKLYKDEGINPLAGCLPLLIQLPIIFALFNTIRRPLTYMLNLSKEQIQNLVTSIGIENFESLNAMMEEKGLDHALNKVHDFEINIAQFMSENIDKIPAAFSNITIVDFNFIGLNLANTPSIGEIGALWLIPIFAGLTSYLYSYYNSKKNPAMAASGNAQTQQMNKMMIYMMPVMSLFFTFSMPAGVGLYWIMSNILMIFQQMVMNKLVPMPAPPAKEEKKKPKKEKVIEESEGNEQ